MGLILGTGSRQCQYDYNMKIRMLCCFGLLLLIVQCFASLSNDITNAIKYAPPTNWYGGFAGKARSDPGDPLFSLDSPELLHYATYGRAGKSGRGDIIFQIGLVGAYVGPGKVIKYLPAEPSDLKKYLESEYKGRWSGTQVSPASIDKIGGLVSVSLTVTRPEGPTKPTVLHFCWVQIDTNIVLKIGAYVNSAKDLQDVTDSLKSLKIDRQALLKLLNTPPPAKKPPKITKDTVNELEVGYIIRDRPYAGFVYHTKAKTYFFTINDGRHPLKTADTEEMLMSKIIKYAHDPKIHCSLNLEIQPHPGAAKASGSTRFNFDDGVHNGRDLGETEIRDGQFFGAWDIVDTGPPHDFHPIYDHRINLELVIQEVQPQEPE
jgi:hypothetical protein